MAELKKCIVIPDSFKGTISAIDVCRIMKENILNIFPDCEVKTFPVADGGEGTVDCFLYALDAEKRIVETTGPYGEPVKAYYARIGDLAILEMAQVAGLPQVEGRMNPRKTTTYGLGKVMETAIADGCTELTIGLGGSCTNDAGIGVARALGAKFYDKDGKEFAPSADEMTRISHINVSEIRRKMQDIHITAMCDITNPMYGENGAAYTFAPQKGADKACVKLLDENLQTLSDVIKQDLGMDVSKIPGAGAAGALGAGIVAFMGGELKSGIHTVLDIVGFDQALNDVQLVFTGEGRVDAQSLQGKVISGVTERAKRQNVPVVVVAGACEEDALNLYEYGVFGIFSSCQKAVDFSIQKDYAKENLSNTMEAILRMYSIA